MNRTLYALLSSLLLMAQPGRSQSGLSLSATVSPFYTQTRYDRQYLYPDSDGQVVEPIYLDGARGSTGYAAGLSLRYPYAPGWSVGTGVWYQQLAFRQARASAAGEGSTTVRSRTVRIPLLLNYQSAASRRLSPYYSMGLLLDFPLMSRVVVTRGSDPTQRLRLQTEPGPVFWGMVGAGVSYRANPHFSVVVQPVATYKLGRFGGARTFVRTIEAGLLTQVQYAF